MVFLDHILSDVVNRVINVENFKKFDVNYVTFYINEATLIFFHSNPEAIEAQLLKSSIQE